jgi:hypothetical protein
MSELKYKVGDKIVISMDAVNCIDYVHSMRNYLGKTMTIYAMWDNYYNIEEDDNDWYWYDDMIDHEATAKLNSQNKPFTFDDLEDGFEIVTSVGSYFVLKKLGIVLRSVGSYNGLEDYNNEKFECTLSSSDTYDAIEIKNREGIIVWNRVGKSQKQIKIERIENEIKHLSEKSSRLTEDLAKLKGEI